MESRRVGSSGLKVSAIAYGNWITHGDQVSAELAAKCVHAALDAGITTFDTADIYAAGQAEVVLGKALAGMDKSSVEICTKVWGPTGPGANQRGLSRKHVIEACEASLRRLGVDHIDLYQAHRHDPCCPLEETLDAFDHLVRQGKVLYLGTSEWTVQQLAEALRLAGTNGLHRFVSNQPQYSMLWRVIEPEVVPFCAAEGISQIVWSPLAQGVLTGKYRPGRPPPAGSRAAGAGEGQASLHRWWLQPDVLSAVDALRPLAAEAGLSLAQLALAWVLSRPNVTAAIIGASRPEQIVENQRAATMRLDADLLAAIDQALGAVVVRDPARISAARLGEN